MQINKIISISIIIVLFAGFASFEFYRKSEKVVLGINSPTEFEIDLNGNNVIDDGETVCVPNLLAFTSDLSANQDEIEKKLNLTNVDALKLGYLTDIWVENTLLDKNVILKYTGVTNQNCKFADIYIDGESFRGKFLNSGFGFDKSFKTNKNFDNNLSKARKLKLIILNHKSNKYHTLDCKYGLIAHDAIIIPERQKPEGAKPCKFCHVQQDKKAKIHHKKFNSRQELTYPLVISDGSLRMFLPDLTTTLKPDIDCRSLVCQETLKYINNTKSSIDIALYGWDSNPKIYKALRDAKSRGVKIRVVYDTSKNSYYPELGNFLKLADEKSTDTPTILMHNKFMIFDNSKVMTGSMNYSKTGLSGFNSNCVFFINSVEVAKMYEEEFSQMLAGKFHQKKIKISHKTVVLGKTSVTPMFSPKDKIITTKVIPMVNNAKNYIYVPAFVLTHDKLAEALIVAKSRGVDVKIIVDATHTSSSRSKIKMLRTAKVPVKVENYAGKMHSKSMIIDDKYIVAGSMNFSQSGENRNDENVLIVEDERLARYYRGFFEYLWKKIPNRYLEHNVRAEGKYSIGSCSDGVDNNFDGKIDKDDLGCR